MKRIKRLIVLTTVAIAYWGAMELQLKYIGNALGQGQGGGNGGFNNADNIGHGKEGDFVRLNEIQDFLAHYVIDSLAHAAVNTHGQQHGNGGGDSFGGQNSSGPAGEPGGPRSGNAFLPVEQASQLADIAGGSGIETLGLPDSDPLLVEAEAMISISWKSVSWIAFAIGLGLGIMTACDAHAGQGGGTGGAANSGGGFSRGFEGGDIIYRETRFDIGTRLSAGRLAIGYAVGNVMKRAFDSMIENAMPGLVSDGARPDSNGFGNGIASGGGNATAGSWGGDKP